jgi:hypothetical protein
MLREDTKRQGYQKTKNCCKTRWSENKHTKDIYTISLTLLWNMEKVEINKLQSEKKVQIL